MDRRVALVTGSSRRLGAVTATRLAKDGFAVAVNSAGAGEADRAVVRAIRERGGVADVFTADVTDADRRRPGAHEETPVFFAKEQPGAPLGAPAPC
jgi:NAD(P)-dependent dehydrogenase (short-subunit alcohol dehydrogenase family)